jgi:hypothetical protein
MSLDNPFCIREYDASLFLFGGDAVYLSTSTSEDEQIGQG